SALDRRCITIYIKGKQRLQGEGTTGWEVGLTLSTSVSRGETAAQRTTLAAPTRCDLNAHISALDHSFASCEGRQRLVVHARLGKARANSHSVDDRGDRTNPPSRW